MARPSKFNNALKETILDLYKRNKTDAQVAAIIGVSVRTINNWKTKYPTFLHAVKEMKFAADDLVEASLFSRATGFRQVEEKLVFKDGKWERAKTLKVHPPDTTAAIFWLKNRQPENWRENYELDIHDVEKKSDEEIDQRIEALLNKRKKGKNE